MDYKLNWEKLLCVERERISLSRTDHRNEFDKDYDRIVYSSSVRRLQDKAQVFPLQENDFTRTRLTHSLEASALARSLGMAVGKWLREKGEFDEKKERQLISLLQVSALIHDLGNPPFGHYGEDIVRNWFKNWFESEQFKNINNKINETLKLKEEEKSDFINFEGNAQTFRILTKLQLLNDQYGANFTYGTLATIMKYPWASNYEEASKTNKFGYFNSESDIAKRIYEATGLQDGIRHPGTFLLEASDDMAYLCADIEDAVKKGIIPWEKEYTSIKDILLKENYDLYKDIFVNIDRQNTINKQNEMPDQELASIQNFKVNVQGLMFSEVIETFKLNYDNIMNGEYEHNQLLKNSNIKGLIRELKNLAGKYCFVNKEVLTLELVGDTVINGLLDKFTTEFIMCYEHPIAKERSGKLYSLISENFKYVCNFDYKEKRRKSFTELRVYDKLLLITDFITGMTDSYAVNLYKELIGVKLP